MEEESMPMSLTGLPPRPPSESIHQQIYPGNDNDADNIKLINEEEELDKIEYEPQRRPTLQDEVKSDSNHSDDENNDIQNKINLENDTRLSLETMQTGQLPFSAFYEDLPKVQLSSYSHGIPTGLEGLKRRLIEENGLDFEGIFRLRGNEKNLVTAREKLAKSESVSSIHATPIEVAQLIKAFYRNIPCDEPGFLPNSLLNAQSTEDIVQQFNVLSEPRKSLLLWTFDLFIKTVEFKPMNKMTLQSMSIVFSPNMVRCSDPNPMIFLELQKKVQRVIFDAAKLRNEHRLILNAGQHDPYEHIVPFQLDRNKITDNATCEGPKYAKYVANNNSNGIAGIFKNCVVL